MGLNAIGMFGLITGISGLMPSVVGLGLNYFVSREIVDLPILEAAIKIRDRLFLSIAICTASVAIFVAAQMAEGFAINVFYCEVVAIIFLEVIGLDVHMCLIGLRMPIFASALLFIRSASWSFVFIVISYINPSLRTVWFACFLWLIASGLSYACLAVKFSQWPWKEIITVRINLAWLKEKIHRGLFIYVSDWALAGSFYLDRFVVHGLVGMNMTGVYMFFWSIANSSQALISSSIIQISLPRLVAAHRECNESKWRKILFAESMKVLIAGSSLSACAYALILIILPHIHREELNLHLRLLVAMLAASIVRMLSDVLDYGIYSRSLDRDFAVTNIIGVILSTSLAIVFVRVVGLNGVGVSMILTAVSLFCLRACILRPYIGNLKHVRKI